MKKALASLPFSKDMAIGVLLFVIILLMILPMPTLLVDALIGLNFGFAILLLMTGIYLSTPLSLSSLPGIILIATIFRLGLSITTTRLILAKGDAGATVETFGSIVVAGNVVVGLVVFFIITVVQFIVIAKGAERIAEVSARFTLDALPGKQMAIDAELRNGDIDNVEAGKRRKLLERESQFYGAMDGAMKFVKGDAIAGLIIIFVNLIGGLVIGIAQFSMPFDEAVHKYSLLTVGDALISQIPALLVSVTAAVIVTRVKGEEQRNLGSDIISQIVADPRAIGLAGVSLIGMGLLPGFPTLILVGLGAAFFAVGFVSRRVRLGADAGAQTGPADGDEAGDSDEVALLPRAEARVVLELSEAHHARFTPADLARRAERLGQDAGTAAGLNAPSVTVAVAPALADDQLRLVIDEEPVLWARVTDGVVTLSDVRDVLAAHDIPYTDKATGLWTRSLEVEVAHKARLDEIGLPYAAVEDVVFTVATDGLIANAANLVGLQETRELLTEAEGEAPVLVAELMRALPIQRIADVFRRLLEERVSLRHRRKIMEALVEWSATDASPVALTEYCRIALQKQICARVAHGDRQISSIVVERDSEEILRASLRDTNIGSYLVLSEEQSQGLLKAVRDQIRVLSPKGIRPVIVTSMDVRRHLKTFMIRNSIEIDVVSFQELSDDYTIIPCSTLSLKPARARTTPRLRKFAEGAESE
ncbi:type III secretion system export apparatus subunit SctV [Roseobacter weihaiensis]|uniref:type III secretion system export apparatus subunit SctV n=1 Tax=Roseobacter weihaiensis TaxID=2763262 RepID=UPI001D0BCD54|nr:type III secretion system export apparatus subunit SctV [Roseobacter sp. H9]